MVVAVLMQIKMVMAKKMAMVKLEMLVATTTTAVVISYMPVTTPASSTNY